MTDRELQKLNRRELLELFRAQARSCEAAKKRLEELEQENQTLKESLTRIGKTMKEQREREEAVDAALAEKTAVLARPLVHYWQRGGSITALSGDLRHWDGTEAIAERYRYFRDRGYTELLAPTFRKFLYHYFLCLRSLDTDSRKGRERLAAVCRSAEPLLGDKENRKNCTAGEKLGLARPLLWKRIHRLRRAGQ